MFDSFQTAEPVFKSGSPLDEVLHHKVGLAAARQRITGFAEQRLRARNVEPQSQRKLDRGALGRLIILFVQDLMEELTADPGAAVHGGILFAAFLQQGEKMLGKAAFGCFQNILKPVRFGGTALRRREHRRGFFPIFLRRRRLLKGGTLRRQKQIRHFRKLLAGVICIDVAVQIFEQCIG